MASTTIFYLSINALKPYFAEAGEGTISAFGILADSLNNAPTKATQWVSFVKDGWCEATERIFEDVSANSPFTAEQRMLLQAMLNIGLDSEALRKHYVHLFKEEFPKCANPDAVLNALGLSNTSQALPLVANRLRVFRALKEGATCWDKANGFGKILAFNDATCEVTFVQGEKERTSKLVSFLKDEIIVVLGSTMEKLINKEKVSFSSETELLDEAKKGIVFCQDVTGSLVKEMLIPEIYTVEEFKVLCTPTQSVPRWDSSRSLLELENRLNQAKTLELENVNWDNIKAILSKEAERMKLAYLRDGRADLGVRWANVVAMLCKEPELCGKLTEILRELLASEIAKQEFGKESDVIRRKCLAAFAEITDSLPGKQVAAWMQLVKLLAGEEFLIEGTLLMPFRLWTHTEQLLPSKEERQRFQNRIFQDFENGKPTADHYAWLWKNHGADKEKRTRFLADSDLLFKTLHRDLKGNYLKSQRNIHKLLKDDAAFQKALMKDGDKTAISNLVRCVKRLPLLDTSEKQSVLVKIVRLYPEAREIVEENVAATQQQSLDRLTSIHSYLRLKEEFEKLVNETIPANSAAIEEARSRGDLSENSEYKYAKEQQRMLNQKRSAMERDLNTCRAIDFAEQEVGEIIIPGAIVTLHFQDGAEKVITLLGLFDTDTEKGWFSYDSPMGRILLAHKVGDRLRVPSGDEATVAKIGKLSDEMLEFLRK